MLFRPERSAHRPVCRRASAFPSRLCDEGPVPAAHERAVDFAEDVMAASRLVRAEREDLAAADASLNQGQPATARKWHARPCLVLKPSEMRRARQDGDAAG